MKFAFILGMFTGCVITGTCAAADRELALQLAGQADGAYEVLELIQAAMPCNCHGPISYVTPGKRAL